MWHLFLPLLLLASSATLCRAADITVEKTSLGRIPGARTPNFRLVTNADLSKAAALDTWKTDDGGEKWYIVLDSLLWEFYPQVDAPSAQFTSDGHLTLLAQHEDKWFIIRDDQHYRDLGPLPCRGLVLSHDGKHDACIQIADKGLRVLHDGKPETDALYDDISPLAMSPQGHLAFTAQARGATQIIRDGKILATFPAGQIFPPAFSADEQHVTCHILILQRDAEQVLQLVDGQPAKSYSIADAPQISGLVQTPDAQHVAWLAEDKRTILVDGHPNFRRQEDVTQLALSTDGKHVATLSVVQNRPGTTLRLDDETFTGRDLEPQSPIKFSEATVVHVTGKTEQTHYSHEDGSWHDGYDLSNANIKLSIYRASGVFANGQILDSGKTLDARILDTRNAAILTEEALPVQVSDKMLHEITTIKVHLKDPPP